MIDSEFLYSMAVFMLLLLLYCIGFKIMDGLSTLVFKKIIKSDSFIKGLYVWIILSIIMASIICFLLGAIFEEPDFIRLIIIALNGFILYLTFWNYRIESRFDPSRFVKYKSIKRNYNILFFSLFNVFGLFIGHKLMSPLYSYSERLIESRYASVITLVIVTLLSAILILIQTKIAKRANENVSEIEQSGNSAPTSKTVQGIAIQITIFISIIIFIILFMPRSIIDPVDPERKKLDSLKQDSIAKVEKAKADSIVKKEKLRSDSVKLK